MFKTALLSSVAAAAALSVTEPRNGASIDGQYIVRLDASGEALSARVAAIQAALGTEHMATMHVYNALAQHDFVAFSARLTKAGVQLLQAREGILAIEMDQVVNINDCQSESNPDWGIARTNYRNYTSTATYTYDYTTGSSGSGIDAYIIDTGIYCENNEFTQKTTGTCSFGYSTVTSGFINPVVDETDGNGHGTHCAGTVAGHTYGVAKEANLIAVKVLSDSGSGSTSGVIDGINWVAEQVAANKKPSVANLSLGGGYSDTQNDAIEAAVKAGVTMVVAAGNDDEDACDYSPASAPSAVTVAASDSKNIRASYSNWGSCVDVFGPGSAITSAWIGSVDATNTISGTSMASPHVCGVAAKYLSADTSMSVADISAKIVADASQNEISDVKGSPNLMTYGYCS
jgi:subtilisin family serine protease